MSQASLLEFEDYLIYSERFNSLLESKSLSEMQPDSMNTFAPPPAIALEPSIQDNVGVPKRSPARLFDRWRTKDKKSTQITKSHQYQHHQQQEQHQQQNHNQKLLQLSQLLIQRLPSSPQPIITKEEISGKKSEPSEPSSPLSLTSTDNNSSLSSDEGSIFSDSKDSNSTQMLLLDDMDDILEEIDDAEIYVVEKVTVTYISPHLCSTGQY